MGKRASVPAEPTSTPGGVMVIYPQNKKKKSSTPKQSNNNKSLDNSRISGISMLDDSRANGSDVSQRKSFRSDAKALERKQDMRVKQRIKKAKEEKTVRSQLVTAKKQLKTYEVKKNHTIVTKRPGTVKTVTEMTRQSRTRMKKTCMDNLLTELESNIPEFDDGSLKNLGYKTMGGAFGQVSAYEITFMGVKCARKTISGSMKELRAEALALNSLSGHPGFPYLFGLTKSGALLMEYISSNANRLTSSTTLRSVLKSGQYKKKIWFDICRKLVDALSFMHDKGLLHNDLHSENILIRSNKQPCIIDFGKCTLVNSPFHYNIKAGSKEQLKFNTYHIHLATELRNVPNSPQTVYTDIYSLGFNFASIGKFQNIEDITKLAKRMTVEEPLNRYDLMDCNVSLLKY